MASFTVRIELHGAIVGDYERLHQKMEAAGYRRYIDGIDASGKAGHWHLPTAEYDFTSSASAAQVRDHSKGIADTVRGNSWCLVTRADDRAWFTQPV